MSTILKALRRLEEDGPDKDKSSDTSAELNAEAVAADVADQAADLAPPTESIERAQATEIQPPPRRAPTDPRATDELRERILAEERASEAARSDRSRGERRARDEALAASASIAETLTPTPDPFANRVVEPAFTPPSSAMLDRPHAEMDSASPSVAATGAGAGTAASGGGIFSRGLMVAALVLGAAFVFLAGFLFSGQTATTTDEMNVAANQVPASAPALTSPSPSYAPTPPRSASAEALAPNRAATQVASAAPSFAEAPAVPIRPMTVPRTKIAAPAPTPTPTEAPKASSRRLQAAAPKAPPVRRPAPQVARTPEPEPVEVESSSALARAAVTPTRAVREAIREPIPQAPAEPVVASRPRPQTFPGERARVSAAAPSTPPPAPEPIQVVEAAKKTAVEELPMAEIAPSRSERRLREAPTSSSSASAPTSTSSSSSTARVLPEAANRAGSSRPSEKPTPTIAKTAPSSRSAAAPIVEMVNRRALPDLTVIRTSWHPTSDRRSAKIRLEETNELVTLREGDSVGGMRIHEISPSAVVFSAGEVQIRRRVGEAPSGR